MRVEINPAKNRLRFWAAIYIVALFLVSIGTLIHYSAGTRIIRSGHYGPFRIGEDRQSALSKVEQMGIKYVEPLPYESIWLKNPTEQQFARLNPYNGILITDSRVHGFPLRVEFSNGGVSKTWPEMKNDDHVPTYMRDGIRALLQLQSQLVVGLPRQEATRFILASEKIHPINVGNFVVGEQEVRMAYKGTMTDSARGLLLHTDAWKFDGLKEEVWYDPYYSQVTLFFKNGRLERIEHFVFPTELP